MLIAAVQASERTGRIANALEEFARHEMALRELRRRVVNAAIYPLLVVVFGLMVSLFLLGYVVPRFSQVFAESSVKLTVSTATILTIGSAINHHAEWVISSLFASAALIAYAIRSPSVRRRAGDLLSKLPPVQRWVRELQLTRITHALAMLLANGFTIPDAMQLASALALRPDLRSAMDRATSHIVAGAFTSAAWQQAGIAEPFAVRVLQAGERTGELGACFESLSQTYRLQVETKLERASRFAEPLLLILVASLIGTIVVLMYIPIVDLATSIG
jgi:general secretion pathway protein F